jgi:hypothetical protein
MDGKMLTVSDSVRATHGLMSHSLSFRHAIPMVHTTTTAADGAAVSSAFYLPQLGSPSTCHA